MPTRKRTGERSKAGCSACAHNYSRAVVLSKAWVKATLRPRSDKMLKYSATLKTDDRKPRSERLMKTKAPPSFPPRQRSRNCSNGSKDMHPVAEGTPSHPRTVEEHFDCSRLIGKLHPCVASKSRKEQGERNVYLKNGSRYKECG